MNKNEVMICDKCGENSQDNKSTNKREIIAICHACGKPIHNDDLVYEVFTSWGISWYLSAGKSEKIIQCRSCYKKWLTKVTEEKLWWKKRKRQLAFCIISSLISVLILLIFAILKENRWLLIIPRVTILLSSLNISRIFYSAPIPLRFESSIED